MPQQKSMAAGPSKSNGSGGLANGWQPQNGPRGERPLPVEENPELELNRQAAAAAAPVVDADDEENDVVVAEEVSTSVRCCLPSGCGRIRDSIILSDPGDAIKVVCNNEACTAGKWMHSECFQQWEEHVLAYLRSSGRARSWSEKQRLQNLWTKKGYDLAFKACDCKCGKGHLKKDLDYLPLPKKLDEKKSKKQKNRKLVCTQGRVPIIGGIQHPADNIRTPLRVRRSSLCSTGSSPPSSEGTPPLTPGTAPVKSGKFEFFADSEQAAAGNIFGRRTDLSAFSLLPRYQQNPYQIKVEDEGPHGNDETRSFILTNLSSQKVTVVQCVSCQTQLPVYDKYPLIDGTFFLSPLQYNKNVSVQAVVDRRRLFLNAVCMRCLDGTKTALSCVACKTRWCGSTLIIGTMYSYDIFAAMPCCASRLACMSCRRPILDPGSPFQFFSEYSRLIQCPHCGSEDYHFVKPLTEILSRGSVGSGNWPF